MPKKKKKKVLKGGIIASHGISIGKAYLYIQEKELLPEYNISKGDVESELNRFEEALIKTKEELENINKKLYNTLKKVSKGDSSNKTTYIDMHLLVLEDEDIKNRVRSRIKKRLKNIEVIFHEVIEEFIETFGNIDDEYLRERVVDIKDVRRRVLRNLVGGEKHSIEKLEYPCILVAHDLTPSDTASMDRENVLGIITEIGGKTSHTSIMARALDIPAIVGLEGCMDEIKNGDMLILDAKEGKVIVNPDNKTIKEYKTAKSIFEKFIKTLDILKPLPSVTKDGRYVALRANIEISDELDSVISHNAEGIGLFRSEFLYLSGDDIPDEETQFNEYKKIVIKMAPYPVTIRTLDIGGDKLSIFHKNYHEINPFLGWRSIRFCLANTDIFKTQLRAILRASKYGKVKIMFPMISGVDELKKALDILDEVKKRLDKEGIEYDKDIEVGIMIEVPGAVMIAEKLAEMVSFFSIGTNDLIQYTVAVDRGNQKVAHLFTPAHPAILRFIKMTIDAGHKKGISVSMCGEMAGDPIYTPILVAMGIDELSMSSISILEVKKVIRAITLREAKKMLNEVFLLYSPSKIRAYLTDYINKKFANIPIL